MGSLRNSSGPDNGGLVYSVSPLHVSLEELCLLPVDQDSGSRDSAGDGRSRCVCPWTLCEALLSWAIRGR
jgi:hypothetical protein